MNAKNLMVFFLTLAITLLVVGSITAGAADELVRIDSVKINDIFASGSEVSVDAGETITVKVMFTALVSASDVRLKLELEGEKVDVENMIGPFTIKAGQRYSKTLTLTVPYELQDATDGDLTLDIKIWNGDFRTEDNSISLGVQRPTYNVAIMSIDSAQSVDAGELLPVEVVLKNTGYDNLNDLFVKVSIPALGIERTSFFGDLISVEDNQNDDTQSKRFFLQIPFDAKAGSYVIEVEASNADLSISKTKQILIKNEFSGSTIVTSMRKSVAVGSVAEFEVIVANPTNKLRVFRIITESNGDLSTSSSSQLIAVPAGETRTVTITAQAHSEGEYDFDVSIFAGEELVDSMTLSVLASGRSASGSVVALTLILAIIFLVLLGALFALLRKKPDQSEEFGESYY